MKIVITGAKGQLGTDLLTEITHSHPEDNVIGIDRNDVDLTNHEAVLAYFKIVKPDAILHLAAYTAVDKAESNIEACEAINVGGTRSIAEAAKACDAKFLYISTDYVFDGTKQGAYFPLDKKNPLSVYGRTKSEGEDIVSSYPKHFIVRTSWVYGKNGHNFPYTMLALARKGTALKVIDDQIGSPTYTPHLSRLIDAMIHTEKYGIYHGTNEGYVSWYDFAQTIFKLAGLSDVNLMSISTKDYPTAAKRPLNSRLSKDCLDEAGFERLPYWQDALVEFLRETGNLKEQGK